jgi:hypothetical protein
MLIDPFLITTVAFGVLTVWLGSRLATERVTARRQLRYWRGRADDLHVKVWCQEQVIACHEEADAKRAQQRRAAAAKGTAVSAVRARLRRQQDDLERPMRAAKTIEALRTTPMRSREAVVAGVKAARTRKQQSGAGAAA